MVRFGDPSGMVMTMSEMQRHDDEATAREATAQTAAQSQPDSATDSTPFEPLTATYERLRHSTDSAELSEFARRPLPDRSDQAAFSRATALLEAVAGNRHTPLEDRIMLAETMPFPNILVKLSTDPSPDVRRAVAANEDDKNWLVGRLTKDEVPEVRDAALRNKRTSWKMRLEGAQNTDLDADTLDVLSRLGVSEESGAPAILATMVRRAVALEPRHFAGDARPVARRSFARSGESRGEPDLGRLVTHHCATLSLRSLLPPRTDPVSFRPVRRRRIRR